MVECSTGSYHFVCCCYVREKFFEIAKYDIIPVVFNGAKMDRIAPRHSYFNLEDFQSIFCQPEDQAKAKAWPGWLYIHAID